MPGSRVEHVAEISGRGTAVCARSRPTSPSPWTFLHLGTRWHPTPSPGAVHRMSPPLRTLIGAPLRACPRASDQPQRPGGLHRPVLSMDDIHRFVRHHLHGTLSTASLRTLLVAVRPAPTAPIAPAIAALLQLLDDPAPATRHERLMRLIAGA